MRECVQRGLEMDEDTNAVIRTGRSPLVFCFDRFSCLELARGGTSSSAAGGRGGSGGSAGGGGKGGGGDMAGATPVIIVPTVPTSLVTLYNAKDFLQDGK